LRSRAALGGPTETGATWRFSLRNPKRSFRGARMLRTALGPAIAGYLEDPSIVEVMLNPDGRLWIDRLSEDSPIPVSA